MKKFLNITSKEFFSIIIFFCVWRLSLFLIGGLADHFLPYQPSFPFYDNVLISSHLPRWLYSWANFDGVYYVIVSEKGYIGTGLVQAFFPLLPLVIVHSMLFLSGFHLNTLLTGLVVTNFFTIALLMIWFAFVKAKINTHAAWIATAVLLLFPTSFFLGAFYTESLFLFLVILSFYAADKRSWGIAIGATFLAVITRVVGVFLIPALLIELWLQAEQKKSLVEFFKKNYVKILLLLATSLGLLLYMRFLQYEFHDPLYFFHVQSKFATGRQENLVIYPQVAWRSLKILLTIRPFDWHYFAYFQEFVVGTLGLLTLLISLRYIRFSQVFFALCAFLLPTLTGTFSSLPRYVLVCFPIFLIFSKIFQQNQKLMVLWLSLSTILLIINTLLYIQGSWVA